MEALTVRVVRDEITSSWRVICDLHGEVSRFGKFWPASRDCLAHRQVCELTAEESGPPE